MMSLRLLFFKSASRLSGSVQRKTIDLSATVDNVVVELDDVFVQNAKV